MTLKYTNVMKPEDINIAHLWLTFAGIVLPVNASAVQREEMRKSFYAGFFECFKIVSDLSEDLSVEDAATVLDRLSKESHDFFHEMIKSVTVNHEL